MAKVSFAARMAKRYAHITGNMDKINVYIHETAVMIMEHAKAHNDCSEALKLVNAMPKSLRRDALTTWFATYSPVTVAIQNDKVGFNAKYLKLKGDVAKDACWDIEAAKANPFYAAIAADKEQKAIAFDLARAKALVLSTLKRIEKEANAEGVNDNTKEQALEFVKRIVAVAA